MAQATVEWGDLNQGLFTPLELQPLRAIDEANFLLHMPDLGQDWRLVFYDFDAAGRPGAIHSLGRANPRVA